MKITMNVMLMFNKERIRMEPNNTKNRTAVAVSYEPNDDAPKVIASGKGYLADKIIEKAKETNIPLHKDSKLADTLSKLEIGDMIPPELYDVVAEILVFVDRLDRIKGKLEN